MSRTEIEDRNTRFEIDEIRPISDHILVEVIERGISEGGFWLPKGEKTECCYGRALKVGPGAVASSTGELMPVDIAPGDLVVSMQYAGERIVKGGKKYRLVRENGIWAKLKMDLESRSKTITEITPYSDHIVVRFDKEEKTLAGHLFLPSNPQTMFRTATIVSVGPGIRSPKTGALIRNSVSPGERVICMRYSGAQIWCGKEELRLQQDVDLLAVIGAGDKVDVIASQPEDIWKAPPHEAADMRNENYLAEHTERMNHGG